ncbi:MAG: FIST signal transduction protein, partial [Polyangia bacterium]
GHDQQALLDGVRAVTGAAPLSGCSAEGVISRAGSDESSHAVGVMVFASNQLRFQTLVARGLSAQSKQSGSALVGGAKRSDEGGELLLVFPDGLTLQSAQLFAGIEAGLARPLQVVGGAAGEMLQFQRTYQYHDGEVLSDAVTGVLIAGDFETEIEVSHGCDVVGTELTVTRAEGGQVFEIDGRPAWSVIQEYLEDDSEDLDGLAVSYSCLAERLSSEGSEGYGPFVIRVPLQLDKATGALNFPGELRTGAKVFMARRDPERIRQNAIRSAQLIAERRRGQSPLAVLQFDCTGRGRLLFGERTSADLIASMQQALDPTAPWLGFHTYGEIAPVLGRMHYHNYTVVLCAIYERRPT